MKRGSFNSDKAEFRLILLLKKISVCLLDFLLDRDRAVLYWWRPKSPSQAICKATTVNAYLTPVFCIPESFTIQLFTIQLFTSKS